MKKYFLVLCVLALAISACSSGSKSPSLVGKWKLTSYGSADSPTPAAGDATIEFGKDGNISGNGGCNSFGGTYKVQNNQITFSDITSTLMACDDARMAQESAVTQVLSGTAEYTINGKTLTLINNGTVLLFTSSNSGSYPNSYP